MITTQTSNGTTASAGLNSARTGDRMFMRCDPARLAYVDRRWEWAFSSLDSCYLWAMQDECRVLLDGERDYRLSIPGPVPVRRCFTIAACDGRGWPLVRTELKFVADPDAFEDDPVRNGIDICFGPERPRGSRVQWIRTTPGIGWFALLRVVNPLEPFFDQSWKPGDLVVE